MTNPRVVVPHIEKLIKFSSLEKEGKLLVEDAKQFEVVRRDLTQYFERIEREIGELKQRSGKHSA